MEALGSTRDLGTGHLVFIFYISFLEVTCISQGFALTGSLCTERVLLICQPLLIPTAVFGLYVCCADHVEWESLLFFAWTPFYILCYLKVGFSFPSFHAQYLTEPGMSLLCLQRPGLPFHLCDDPIVTCPQYREPTELISQKDYTYPSFVWNLCIHFCRFTQQTRTQSDKSDRIWDLAKLLSTLNL